jgi:peptide/nickel transport system permease protein
VRPLLVVSVSSVAVAGLVGLVYGVVAAMTGGWVEFLLMRLADIQLSLPLFVLALLLAFTLRPGVQSSVIAIVVATWPYYARLVRVDVIRTRSSAFVQLARVAGRHGLGLTLRHVLPNSLNGFAALCVLNLGVVVIVAAGLSVLGLGVQPPTADWGNMVAEGTQYLDQWWMVTTAGLAICTLVVATNALGRWARRALEVDVLAEAAAMPGGLDSPGALRPRRGADGRAPGAAPPERGRPAPLAVEGLSVAGPGGRPILREVSLSVPRGAVVGIMGESGSGKSTICRAIVGLLPPGLRVTGGTLGLGAWRVSFASPALAGLRGRHVGIVFQDALSSLNPLLRVGVQLGETRRVHGMEPRPATRRWVPRTLSRLGFPDPQAAARSHPHQLSGGMRQRVCTGIALAGEPRLVLADEPTTALDVSLQGRILALLADRCREQGASLVIVTHDVRVVRAVADQVVVLYGGRVLESGPAQAVLGRPRSPYTRALLDSVPALVPADRERELAFIPPARTAPPADGCPFAGRCAREVDRCRRAFPLPAPAPGASTVWCWNPEPAGGEAER